MAEKCPYCGAYHEAKCPMVAAMEYHPDGTLKRVEFHPPQPVIQGEPLRYGLAPNLWPWGIPAPTCTASATAAP